VSVRPANGRARFPHRHATPGLALPVRVEGVSGRAAGVSWRWTRVAGSCGGRATTGGCSVHAVNTDAPITVETATVVDDELVAAFGRLIPQLSSSSPPPSREQLAELVGSDHLVLYLARDAGQIVGSLTLAFYRIPTGLKAWIEDVVVDEVGRGRGVGKRLSEAAIAEARRRGAKDVNLSSRPSREAANRLYLRLGFEVRESNMYRYKF
jgi:ribosomal protein S18 acetylase RimI-like enzyme